MANVVGIMGQSGSGKTTAARTLNPETTFYIDADKKGLSWRGWRAQYVPGKNYVSSSDIDGRKGIWNLLSETSLKLPHVNAVIVDTMNGVMIDDEFRRMKQHNYDKWLDLAASIYEIVVNAHSLRPDLTIFFMFHSITERDESGYSHTSILTSGQKLKKIHLESKLTTNLWARSIITGEDCSYVFQTQARFSTAKSPMGMFNTLEIPNDLEFVRKTIVEYNQ